MNTHPIRIALRSACITLIATFSGAAQPPAAATDIIAELRAEAERLRPLVETDAARAFLDAAAALPHPGDRTVYRGKARGVALREDEYNALSEADKSAFTARSCDERFYYMTGYGSPLVYVRPLDLVASRAGWTSFEGKRILDFGYGSIGHLRLLAANGAAVTGVEVEPLLHALYSWPNDTGEVANAGSGRPGSVRLLLGRWPGDSQIANDAGRGYDLIISKNVLKFGYIHPRRPADESRLVKLGVDDAAFMRAAFDALNPGGLMMVYNICPAQNSEESGKPYLPHADGEFPFDRDLVMSTGFEVVAFDERDDERVLDIWAALGYDDGKPRDEARKDIRCWWTLLRRTTK